MSLVILNPHLLPNLFGSNIHGYAIVMIQFFACWKVDLSGVNTPRKLYLFLKFLFSYSLLAVRRYRFRSQDTDSVVCFNHPLDWPSKVYSNLVLHCNDYFYSISKEEIVEKVSHLKPKVLLGYTKHDKFSRYFRSFGFDSEVVEVPFGYTDRFVTGPTLHNRKVRCLLSGAIEHNKNLSCESFFGKAEPFFHPERYSLRKKILSNQAAYGDYFENLFPQDDEIRGISYDIVAAFHRNWFFFCGLSIERFPPAKLYEGAATGCIPIISGAVADERWVNGVNCLILSCACPSEIIRKIKGLSALEIHSMSNNASELARAHFSHFEVARVLTEKLTGRFTNE